MTNQQEQPPPTWVDRVMQGWVASETSIPTHSHDPSLSIGLICWNVLADSYCNRRSHRKLPLVYQNHVFDKHQRQHHVRQTLRRM